MSDKRHKWEGWPIQKCERCHQRRRPARIEGLIVPVWLYRYGLEWIMSRKVPSCGGAR